MSQSDGAHFGELPNAIGTITRLAYANAKANKIDTRPLLAKAGLTLHQIRNPAIRLRAGDQIKFISLVGNSLRDDWFGFHLAQSPDLREFGFLYYVSASSDTLGQALHRLARYVAIANEGAALRYLDAGSVGVTFHYVGVGRHLDRHQIEFFMVFLVRLCRQLTGIRLAPTRVRVVHHRGGQCPEFARFFGGNVKFGAAVDEVSFAAAVKNMPVVTADNYLNKVLVSYCEEALARRSGRRGSFRASVENAIAPLLPHGDANLAAIARRLGLGQRTLARRLAAESLTFSDVLQNLKVELAWRYLADRDLSISQVAWLLGYQEVSSLTHAFKRWTGRTPRQARMRMPR
jgi:AraC-like DNA-binding protein